MHSRFCCAPEVGQWVPRRCGRHGFVWVRLATICDAGASWAAVGPSSCWAAGQQAGVQPCASALHHPIMRAIHFAVLHPAQEVGCAAAMLSAPNTTTCTTGFAAVSPHCCCYVPGRLHLHHATTVQPADTAVRADQSHDLLPLLCVCCCAIHCCRSATDALRMVGEMFPWQGTTNSNGSRITGLQTGAPSELEMLTLGTPSTQQQPLAAQPAPAAAGVTASSSSSSSNSSRGSAFIYTRSNHNSVLGIGAYAAAAGAELVPQSDEGMEAWVAGLEQHQQQKQDAVARGANGDSATTYSLLAYPAEDNFAGVIYPLDWINRVGTGKAGRCCRASSSLEVKIHSYVGHTSTCCLQPHGVPDCSLCYCFHSSCRAELGRCEV